MIQDVTASFIQALETQTLWAVKDYYLIVEILKQKYNFITDYDKDEGQTWVSFHNETESLLLWTKYPLIIAVEKSNCTYLNDLLNEFNYVSLILLQSMQDKMSIDYNPALSNFYQIRRIEEVFSFINDPEININSFTASDLWFHSHLY